MSDEIKQVGSAFVRTDLGDGLPEITYHREPEHVGGARYARCQGCGSESVEDSNGEFGILHDPDCPRPPSGGPI